MRIYLAPMEGVVDHHLRHILSRVGGIDICVTEFVRVTDHVLPEKVFKRYSPELLHGPALQATADDGPLPKAALCPTRVQLLGSNAPKLAGNARKAARMGAPGIDLNFGCPAKTVNKNRGGACLLQEPETLYDIVSQVRQAVPMEIPVTAKIRLGYEERNGYIENAQAICEAGANEIVVHARSKSDGYRPPAYWEYISEIKHHSNIPIIANGDIWSADNYQQCVERSQCEDVMLGRGLLAKPDLALEIKSLADDSETPYTPMPWSQVAALLLEFFEITTKVYPKKYMGNRAKQWLFYLKRQYPEAVQLFDAIKRSRDYHDIKSAIEQSMLSAS
ncbi:MAG: tRNA-dihydrouridine synthase family protein [Agarilytica sp.]